MNDNKSYALPELDVYVKTVRQIMFDSVEEFAQPYRDYMIKYIEESRELDNSFLFLLGSGMRIENKVFKIAAGLELFNIALAMHETLFALSLNRPDELLDKQSTSLCVISGDFLIYKCLAVLSDLIKYDSLKKIIKSTGVIATGELRHLNVVQNFEITKNDYLKSLKATGFLNAASLSIGLNESFAFRETPDKIVIDLATESFSVYSHLVKEVNLIRHNNVKHKREILMPIIIAMEDKIIDQNQVVNYSLEQIITILQECKAIDTTLDIALEYKESALSAFSKIIPNQSVIVVKKMIDYLADYIY